MNSVEIILNKNKLEREVYTFWLENEYWLWLDNYTYEVKLTPRHKFKIKRSYYRLEPRDSTLKEEEVVFNDELKQMALNKLISQIKVKKWSERKC